MASSLSYVLTLISSLPEFTTTNDVAQLLGVHRRTVARWVKSGLLSGVRTAARGGKFLISRQSLIDRMKSLHTLNSPLTVNEALPAVHPSTVLEGGAR